MNPDGANARLGLPRQDKMQKVAICFDVDGTLIDKDGKERYNTVVLVGLMAQMFKNAKIVIWSGGGEKYAWQRAGELGIDHLVWKFLSKHQHTMLREQGYKILAIDDIQDTAIGAINLIVKQ